MRWEQSSVLEFFNSAETSRCVQYDTRVSRGRGLSISFYIEVTFTDAKKIYCDLSDPVNPKTKINHNLEWKFEIQGYERPYMYDIYLMFDPAVTFEQFAELVVSMKSLKSNEANNNLLFLNEKKCTHV